MADRRGVSWRRLLSEAVVIVASVYLAIVLEGMSDDRDRATEAVDALVQLVEELRKDRSDVAEVIAEQENLSRLYVNLRRWFEDPSSMPADSVQETLDLVAWSNRTMFPRGAAWTTMVAAGQLRYLEDVALVTRLGDLYENVNPRIEYNGAAYDASLNTVMRESVPTVWDFEGSRLVTGETDTSLTDKLHCSTGVVQTAVCHPGKIAHQCKYGPFSLTEFRLGLTQSPLSIDLSHNTPYDLRQILKESGVFHNIVPRTEFHHFHRNLLITLPGHHHERNLAACLPQSFHHLFACHIRQLVI